MAVFNLRGWMFVQLGPFFSPYNYFCIKSRLSRFLSSSYKPHSCLIDSTITTASPTVSPTVSPTASPTVSPQRSPQHYHSAVMSFLITWTKDKLKSLAPLFVCMTLKWPSMLYRLWGWKRKVSKSYWIKKQIEPFRIDTSTNWPQMCSYYWFQNS